MEVLSVTASTLQVLREKIINGELKPGQKLNESALSLELGISRPPLREAFRLMETDHLVVNVPRKGTFVTELSVKDFMEVSQAREMIECYTIDLLEASGKRHLPAVAAALDKALGLPLPLKNVEPAHLADGIRVLLDFHAKLVESSGNSLLTHMYRSISSNLARYQFIYFFLNGAAEHSLADHKRTLEFIRAGRYDRAREELKGHIRYAVELVKSRISAPALSRAG
jgi:DNA-binding GntR family transcriptional regulator